MRNSVYQLGSSNLSNDIRSRNDFYITDRCTIQELLNREVFNHNIWEPACGTGSISECLDDAGYNVISTDIQHYGYVNQISKLDFLHIDENSEFYQKYDIITNPPYTICEEFVTQGIKLCKNKCAFLLKIQFLETVKRYKNIFQKYPPKIIYVFSNRQVCSKYEDFYQRDFDGNIKYSKSGKPLKVGSAILYCWFVWEKGFNRKTVIDWII